MQNQQELNPGKPDLPEALRSLELAPLTSSPRMIWYEAGMAAGRRKANQWRAATVALLAVTIALSLVRWPTPSRQVATSPPPQQSQAAASTNDSAASTASQAYTRLLDSLILTDTAHRQADPPAAAGGQVDPEPESFNRISPTGWYRASDRG